MKGNQDWAIPNINSLKSQQSRLLQIKEEIEIASDFDSSQSTGDVENAQPIVNILSKYPVQEPLYKRLKSNNQEVSKTGRFTQQWNEFVDDMHRATVSFETMTSQPVMDLLIVEVTAQTDRYLEGTCRPTEGSDDHDDGDDETQKIGRFLMECKRSEQTKRLIGQLPCVISCYQPCSRVGDLVIISNYIIK